MKIRTKFANGKKVASFATIKTIIFVIILSIIVHIKLSVAIIDCLGIMMKSILVVNKVIFVLITWG